MKILQTIYRAAIDAVSPKQMLSEALSLKDNHLMVSCGVQNVKIRIDDKRIHVVAFGKAVIGMVTSVQRILGPKLTSGVAIVPKGIKKDMELFGRQDLLPQDQQLLHIHEGAAMNMPDSDCVRASQEVYNLISSLREDDVLLTLISGGGSALLTYPVPPLTLEDLVNTTTLLAKAGASITELNTVRKHLEVLKGGGLSAISYPAKVVSLILSDIVGDPLESIASGPTVVDTSTNEDALEVLKKYATFDQVPEAVKYCLEKNLKAEFLKGKDTPLFKQSTGSNVIVGSNMISLRAAADECRRLGLTPAIVTHKLTGEAANIGSYLAEMAYDIINGGRADVAENVIDVDTATLNAAIDDARASNQPLCLLFGGETTVTVRGTGKGGRNMELCLSAAIRLSELGLTAQQVVLGSIGTDGQDGPTDAAGAVVTSAAGETMPNQPDPRKYLAENDSYSYFSQILGGQCLVKTGLTDQSDYDALHRYKIGPRLILQINETVAKGGRKKEILNIHQLLKS